MKNVQNIKLAGTEDNNLIIWTFFKNIFSNCDINMRIEMQYYFI